MTGLATAVGYWLAAISAFAVIPWARDRSIMRFILIGGIAGGALAPTLVATAVSSYDAIASLLVYTFLCELFVFLFTLVEGSISVATLLRLYRGLPLHTKSEGNFEYAVLRRIEVMKRIGLITRAGNRFSLTCRGKSLLQAARCLQRFFHHGGQGETRRAL